MFIGLDLGTSNIKAVVVDGDGRPLAESSAPVGRVALPGGGVEQDIEQIWSAACDAIRRAIAPVDARQIQALGISSQGGALQLLDGQQRPVGRVISWFDGRGGPYDESLSQRWGDDFLVEHLGRAPCCMTPGQWLRLRTEQPGLLAQAAGVGFVGDVIVGRLAGRRAHDSTSLSIAMLFSPSLGRADPTVLEELQLNEDQLPALLPATTPAGRLQESAAALTGLPAGIPVSPAVHDQYAALLGAGAVQPGDVSLGTGSAWVLLVNTTRLERPVIRGAFVCTHPVNGLFGQLISMVNGGSALAWAMQLLGRSGFSPEGVDAAAASVPVGSGGLCFWPLLAAGAASSGTMRGGRLSGIGFDHTPSHFVRAVLEGLACELARYVGLCQTGGLAIDRLVLSGSAAGSRVTPQIIADVTGRPVLCSTRPATSAWGAAVLARSMIEPEADLARLASAWAAESRRVEPGADRGAYAAMLERYLEPFIGFEPLAPGTSPVRKAASRETPPAPLYYVWQYTDVDRRFWRERLEDWVPSRIFDAHTHVNAPQFRLEEMTQEKRRQYWVNEVGEPIAAADADRCHRLVFPGREFNCLAFGFPLLEYDLEASNADLQRAAEQYGWYRLVVVRPQWSAERIAAELQQPRALGVKVYYSLISHDPTSRDKHLEASIFDYLPPHQLDVLNHYGAWVTLHVPKAARLGHPDNLAEIRQIRHRWPNVILVIAHLGRCYTPAQAEEALPALVDDPGLYFDISAVMNPEVLRRALELFGPERILFGTDNPVFYMRGRQRWEGRQYVNHTSYPFYFNKRREPPEIEAGYALYMYEALWALRQACRQCGLTRPQVEQVFHGNAERLVARAAAREVK